MDITIVDTRLKQVSSFKYLGATINKDSNLEDEIMART